MHFIETRFSYSPSRFKLKCPRQASFDTSTLSQTKLFICNGRVVGERDAYKLRSLLLTPLNKVYNVTVSLFRLRKI